jgi:NhaP-type Na+/H+ or K+/H+ antiporter
VAGWLGLKARRRVPGATLSTALSFAVPFVAFLPAERLHASGFVAVVTAGLITGAGSARYLSPQDRVSERSNWSTVETLLEGGLFGLLGLELFGLVEDVRAQGYSLLSEVAVAALAVAAVLVIRGAYLAPLLWSLAHRVRRGAAQRDQFVRLQDRLDERFGQATTSGTEKATLPGRSGGPRAVPAARLERIRQMIGRRLADIDYLSARPLGPREGVLLVWAGMRGVVTLAAAQSLPVDFPHRSFVVLVAFIVAAGTLLVQGGTLPWVVRRLGLTGTGSDPQELAGLRGAAREAASELLADPGLTRPAGGSYDASVVSSVRASFVREQSTEDDEPTTEERRVQFRELRLRVIEAERAALLAARSSGLYDSRELERVLDLLDADQIALELRSGPAQGH